PGNSRYDMRMVSFRGHPGLHIYSRYRNPPSQGEKYKIKYPLGQNSMQSTRADKENDEVKSQKYI
ncbi:MAG: hypothetical protein OEV22_18670, partial [Deltaproteobacteria bacterium]|nr:hypothetical protein [Deltaproteobacteria bacterium]